jgi:hypothetical protein
MKDYYKPGTWNVACPVCGQRYKSDEMKKRWDGLWVCRYDWEPRHPQDLIKIKAEETNKVAFSYHETEVDVSPSWSIPFESVPPGTFDNGL